MMSCTQHILDHDEKKGIVIDVRVQLTDHHGDGVEDQVDDEHEDGANQFGLVKIIIFFLFQRRYRQHWLDDVQEKVGNHCSNWT